MTEQEKEELKQEIENLKMLIEFHTSDRMIEDEREFEHYIDAILDRIREIEDKMK